MTSCWECDGSKRESESMTGAAENLPNRPEACLCLIGEFSRHFENNKSPVIYEDVKAFFLSVALVSSFRASTDGWMNGWMTVTGNVTV